MSLIAKSILEWADYWESEILLRLNHSWKTLWLDYSTVYDDWTPLNFLERRRNSWNDRIDFVTKSWVRFVVVENLRLAQSELISLLKISGKGKIIVDEIEKFIIDESKFELFIEEQIKPKNSLPNRDSTYSTIVFALNKDDAGKNTLLKLCLHNISEMRNLAWEQVDAHSI